MTTVIIDGIEYIPKIEGLLINDKRLQGCLEVLTEMRRFNQHHKMRELAWNAINELSPDIAKLSVEAAYYRIHGEKVNK